MPRGEVIGSPATGADLREIRKSGTLGFCCGMTAQGLRREMQGRHGVLLGDADAAGCREQFYSLFPKIRQWQEEVTEKQRHESRTFCGRRLLLGEATPDRVRYNATVQGTAADGLKRSLALLWERRASCPNAVPILAVRDEIVIECDEANADGAVQWLRWCMTDGMQPLLRPVPVEAQIGMGKSWEVR